MAWISTPHLRNDTGMSDDGEPIITIMFPGEG